MATAKTTITTTVNGNAATLELDGHESAVDVIRTQLGLTGTKLVCAGGVCGACTVQLNGEPVASCLTPATAMRDAAVTTVEGLADGDDASVSLASGVTMSVADLIGDGVDPTRDHQLPDGDVIAAIELPPAWDDERAVYFRSIGRFEAEWSLVEAVVRARFDGDRIAECRIGLGGVATVPLRMSGPEALLTGAVLDDDTIAAVSSACTEGASPLPETGYKVDLIVATVTETLERLRRTDV
jgi:xanthine dehydrogenase iron-sulfur cluster and FAD-binding subunit A